MRDTVDGTGAVLNHIVFDSFGNILSRVDGAREMRYLFTGREYIPRLDLYSYRARYYDPRLGRFLTEDPIRFASGDPNLYRYVQNRVTELVDPYGWEGTTEFPESSRDIINEIGEDLIRNPPRDLNEYFENLKRKLRPPEWQAVEKWLLERGLEKLLGPDAAPAIGPAVRYIYGEKDWLTGNSSFDVEKCFHDIARGINWIRPWLGLQPYELRQHNESKWNSWRCKYLTPNDPQVCKR